MGRDRPVYRPFATKPPLVRSPKPVPENDVSKQAFIIGSTGQIVMRLAVYDRFVGHFSCAVRTTLDVYRANSPLRKAGSRNGK